jgi:hypothetical protein
MMLRRDFIRTILSAGGALAYDLRRPVSRNVVEPDAASAVSNTKVKRVLVMFKCHFDAGFIDTQARVVTKYFTQYFPEAIRVAEQTRETGKRYVWTTGSWLLYEYLEQASSPDRKRMERAVTEGDIAWHALPFNWQTEMVDNSLIIGSLGLSESLDRRFGKRTTGAKMTDVPGHTRGLIAPLASKGITFLDIGVNAASQPAELPAIFAWRDQSGAVLTVMYHSGYGGITQIPESDIAIAVIVRGDNSGPHTAREITEIYSELNRRFPEAEIIAADLSTIAKAAEPHRASLPVISQEIGDTWIYGVASDPLKVARYLEVCRLRQKWINEGRLTLGGGQDVDLLRHLLLEAEHTWGTDTKTWLDFDHYKPRDLGTMQHTKNYEVVEYSWEEKRRDLFDGIATLPNAMRTEAEQTVRALAVVRPTLKRDTEQNPEAEVETRSFIIKLDPETGAIQRLMDKSSGREWASAGKLLGLLSYQTLAQEDYDQFFRRYLISNAAWAPKDFGKPNVKSFAPKSKTWYPKLTSLRCEKADRGCRLLSELQFSDPEAFSSGLVSYPSELFCEMFLPENDSKVYLTYYWFGKRSTRLPEALWLTINPIAEVPDGWTLRKSGQSISPFDVVACGGRHMHAVEQVRYRGETEELVIDPLDAPVVALGGRSPLNFSRDQPTLDQGIHFSLFNNAWGTNYIQWFGEDMRFRFVLKL